MFVSKAVPGRLGTFYKGDGNACGSLRVIFAIPVDLGGRFASTLKFLAGGLCQLSY